MWCIEVFSFLAAFLHFPYFFSGFCLGGRSGEWGIKVNGDDSISRLGSDIVLFYVSVWLYSAFFAMVTLRMEDWCWEEVFLSLFLSWHCIYYLLHSSSYSRSYNLLWILEISVPSTPHLWNENFRGAADLHPPPHFGNVGMIIMGTAAAETSPINRAAGRLWERGAFTSRVEGATWLVVLCIFWNTLSCSPFLTSSVDTYLSTLRFPTGFTLNGYVSSYRHTVRTSHSVTSTVNIQVHFTNLVHLISSSVWYIQQAIMENYTVSGGESRAGRGVRRERGWIK